MSKIKHFSKSHYRAKILTGVLVILFGGLFLANAMGAEFPFKLFSWKILLICLGIIDLVKHDFKKMTGYILLAIGGIFLLDDITSLNIETKFLWPILIIIIGISILYKNINYNAKKRRANDTVMFDDETVVSDEDFFESNAIFGGVNKSIVSKNFRGAKVGSYFGGTELNLTKADISGTAIIDISNYFGGTSVIVPSGWDVRSEMTTIFGGVEDKRPVIDQSPVENKILILKGTCAFGGVEIQSYV